jgi:hypothetical protein
MVEPLIEIKLSGYTIFLTHKEMATLLSKNKPIWKESIKRGKYILRCRKQRERESDRV